MNYRHEFQQLSFNFKKLEHDWKHHTWVTITLSERTDSLLSCSVFQGAADPVAGPGHEGAGPRQAVEPAGGGDPPAPPQDRHPSLQGAQRPQETPALSCGACEWKVQSAQDRGYLNLCFQSLTCWYDYRIQTCWRRLRGWAPSGRWCWPKTTMRGSGSPSQ